MRQNTLKAKLASGKSAIGFMVMYDWPEMVQMAAHLGADYVMIDGEHGYIGVPEVARLVRAAESVGITPIARVPRNAQDLILGFLDAGAQGIIIPNVNTAEEAAYAVASVKYAPEGRRGAGYGHPMEWMINTPFGEYVKVANRETMVFPQCESLESVGNIDAIAKVPGVDGIMMGPADLAQSMGLPGQVTHPDVKAALSKAQKAILAAGKIVASPAMDGDTAKNTLAAGSQMLVCGAHRIFISAAKEYMAKARS